jgi:hypothetical protein
MGMDRMDADLREFLKQNGWDANWSRQPLTSEEMDDFIEYLIRKRFHIESKTTPLISRRPGTGRGVAHAGA